MLPAEIRINATDVAFKKVFKPKRDLWLLKMR